MSHSTIETLSSFVRPQAGAVVSKVIYRDETSA